MGEDRCLGDGSYVPVCAQIARWRSYVSIVQVMYLREKSLRLIVAGRCLLIAAHDHLKVFVRTSTRMII